MKVWVKQVVCIYFRILNKACIHYPSPHQNSNEYNVNWGHWKPCTQSTEEAHTVLLQQLCGLCICICVYFSDFMYVCFTFYVQLSAWKCGHVCVCVFVSVRVYEIRWAHCSIMNGNHTAPSRQPCVTFWNPNKRWSVIVCTHTHTHSVMMIGDAGLLWKLNLHVSLPGELMFLPK